MLLSGFFDTFIVLKSILILDVSRMLEEYPIFSITMRAGVSESVEMVVAWQ